MLARCPPDELGTILEAFGSPAFVVGPSAGGSAPVLAANGRLLAALESLSFSDLAVPGAKSRAGMMMSEVALAHSGPDLFQACRFPRRSPFQSCRVATLRP